MQRATLRGRSSIIDTTTWQELDLSYLWGMINLRRPSLGQHPTVLHTDTVLSLDQQIRHPTGVELPIVQ